MSVDSARIVRAVMVVAGLVLCLRLAFVDFPRELDASGWGLRSVLLLVALLGVSALLLVGPISRARRRATEA